LAGGAGVRAAIVATDQVIVHWASPTDAAHSADPSLLARLEAAVGKIRFVRSLSTGGAVYRLPTRLGPDADPIIAVLKRVRGVASVAPDPIVTLSDLPTIPMGLASGPPRPG